MNMLTKDGIRNLYNHPCFDCRYAYFTPDYKLKCELDKPCDTACRLFTEDNHCCDCKWSSRDKWSDKDESYIITCKHPSTEKCVSFPGGKRIAKLFERKTSND